MRIIIKTLCCFIAAILLSASAAASELQATIDSFVQENETTTAAMSFSVFTNQDVLLEASYGYINIEKNVLNHPEAVFEWGSVSKLLVSVSALQLAERYLLGLDADIRSYLPDGFLRKLKYDDPITMHHLLNHTAGFQESFLLFSVTGDLGDALRMSEPPQILRPGSVTAYSNYGSALAGYVMELITGKPFYQYVHDNIFAPLGMTRTALKPDLSDNAWVQAQRRNMHCYTKNLRSLSTADFKTYLYPAGMATGTISDMRKFGQALLPDENGASPLFRQPETIIRLQAPSTYYPDGESGRNHYGFWGYTHFAGRVIGHAGNTSGMSASLVVDLENNIGAAVMTNQAMEAKYNRDMLWEIFGEQDYSRLDNSAFDVIINGLFRSTRDNRKGIYKLSGLRGYRPFFQQGENTLSTPFFGTLSKVAPGVYKTDADFDMSVLFFVSADENGNAQHLTAMFSNYERMGWGSFIIDVAALLLFAVSALYGLIVLVIMLIKKLRKKEQIVPVLRASICAGSLLALVNLVLFVIGAITSRTALTGIAVHGVLFILLAIGITAGIARLILRMRTLDLSKKQKRQLVRTFVMGAFAALNIIYWQLWMFWV